MRQNQLLTIITTALILIIVTILAVMGTMIYCLRKKLKSVSNEPFEVILCK